MDPDKIEACKRRIEKLERGFACIGITLEQQAALDQLIEQWIQQEEEDLKILQPEPLVISIKDVVFRHTQIDSRELTRVVNFYRKHGMISPLRVERVGSRVGTDETLKIVAARLAGLKEVPIIIKS